jgi:hypothetical protein
MSSQSRAYSFAPLFGGPFPDQQMRVSDSERQAVTDRLAEHFTEGRLDQAEFDERVARAMSAKTRADLNGLFDDLPEPGNGGPRDARAPMPARPHGHGHHPVLLLVLVVLVVLAAAHALFAGPWLWLGLIVAAVLFATRGTRCTRPSQNR